MKVRVTFPAAILHSHKIHCIKLYRFITDEGLRESKDAIESVANNIGIDMKPYSMILETSKYRTPPVTFEDIIKQTTAYLPEVKVETLNSPVCKGTFDINAEGVVTITMEQGTNSLKMETEYSKMAEVIEFFTTVCIKR